MHYTFCMQDFFFSLWNHMPWVWLVLTVVFILIEATTMSLTTIWFACAAFVMVFISLLPLPGHWQLLIFTLISLLLLIFTRPIVRKRLRLKKTATNSDSLIGRKTVVQDAITALEKGTVKIGGIVWTARCADDSALAPGEECVIQSIEGNTLIVKKSEKEI